MRIPWRTRLRVMHQRFWWPITLLLLALGWWQTQPTPPSVALWFGSTPQQISADGRVVVTTDGQVRQLPDGALLQRLPITGQAFVSANGRFVATITQNKSTSMPIDPREEYVIIRFMDLMHLSTSQQIRTPIYSVLDVSIHPLGTMLIFNTGYQGADGWLLYDTQTSTQLPKPPAQAQEPGSAHFSPDGRVVLLGGRNGFRMLDTTTWEVLFTTPQRVGASTYTPTTQLVAFLEAFQIKFLVLPGAVTTPMPLNNPFFWSGMSRIAFSPDGQYLIATKLSGGSSGAWISFTDNTGDPVELALIRVADGAVVQRFKGSRGDFYNPVFSSDGQYVATIGPHNGVSIWPVHPREPWLQWCWWAVYGLGLVRTVIGWRRWRKQRRAAKMV